MTATGRTDRSPRVRVATVAPGVEPWRSETLRLFWSLRSLGGSIAGAEAVCYFDRVVDARVAESLRSLDVAVRLIAPVDPRCAMGNNQIMLEEDGSYDWLVALDCDVVVTADFSHELTGDAVAAAPVDHSLVPLGEWAAFFAAFGVTMPPVRYRSRCHNAICPAYFNAGVLLVPSGLVQQLRAAWARWLVEVVDSFDQARVPSSFGGHRAFTDQLAFALALAAEGIPHRALPLSMNAPSHLEVHPINDPEHVDPFIVHYHHNIDESGELPLSGHRGIDAAISRVNAALAMAPTAWYRA